MQDTGCKYPLCKYHAVRDGFCLHHAKHFAGAKPVKERKAIPKRSPKRVEEQAEYVALVKKMLAENSACEIKAPGCTKKAQGLHHVQKRTPANYLLRSNLKRACNSCNLYIELHPIEAIEKGWSVSKHIKPNG